MQAIFECAPQGDFIGLRSTGLSRNAVKSERGDVKAFSWRSRSRLMKKISQLRKHHLPLFVTLTYPSVFPTDHEEYKYHVHKFFIYLFRRFPSAGVIWKLEFQSRGAAHFHILLFGVDYDEAAEWIPQAWYKIAGSDDPLHLAFHRGELGNQPCVGVVRSWHGVKSYASKYMSKLDKGYDVDQETGEVIDVRTGRFWGVRGDVPFSPIITMRINIKTALEFRRAFRRWSGMTYKYFGFWGYGFSDNWLRFIDVIETQVSEEEFWKNSIPPPDERHDISDYFFS